MRLRCNKSSYTTIKVSQELHCAEFLRYILKQSDHPRNFNSINIRVVLIVKKVSINTRSYNYFTFIFQKKMPKMGDEIQKNCFLWTKIV